MTKSKKGQISPIQLFFIFFVSRSVVSLTYVQAVSVGSFNTDVLISFGISYFATLLLSVPVILCIKKGRNATLPLVYIVYYLFFSSITVSRFSYFASIRMNPKIPMVLFIIVSMVAIAYGAYLGLEGLGRFSSFCGGVLVAVLLVVLVCNFSNFKVLNLYPIFENSPKDMALNTLLFSCNAVEPALLFPLAKNTNGNSIKPYFAGISVAYLVVFLLLLFCCGVFGAGADLQAFPIYALFQMASIGDMSRLDIFHTSFWVFAVFLKTSVLVYSASVLIKKYTYKNKVLVLSAISTVMSIVINQVIGTAIVGVSKIITVLMFVICVIILPIIALIFRKGKYEKA